MHDYSKCWEPRLLPQILHVQEGLNDALRISKELFSTGRIPIFQFYSFSEPLKKNGF